MFQFLRKSAFLTFFVLVLWITACKNSDSWLARNYHNTVAHYNKFFNANEKWEETKTNLQIALKDDYRTYLDLYNYGPADALKANQGSMDEVIKDLSLLIDRHPKSKWVDDSYLLTGKAYFLKGDFNAAIDLFEYVIKKYKDPLIVYQARLWIFQSLLMQKKNNEAEALINSLLADKSFPKKLNASLQKAVGSVLLKNGKHLQGAEALEKSIQGTRNREERIRMHYVLGQAYLNVKKYDLAKKHFTKTARMNPAYEMAFNAKLNMVEILTAQEKNYTKANKVLKDMLRDDKNTEYLGQIYFKMATNYLAARNLTQAMEHFQLALSNSNGDNSTKTNVYLALGDFYNQKKNFQQAGLYYDSASMSLDEKHPNYEQISKKSLMLSDLLRQLITIKTQDSLLTLAKDPELRERAIDKQIELEKRREQQALQNQKQPKGKGNTGSGSVSNTNSGLSTSAGNIAIGGNASFPFYNAMQRNQGKTDFEKIWGKRVNRDNWRLNSKKTVNGANSGNNGSNEGNNGAVSDSNTTIEKNPGQGTPREKYYSEIPMSAEAQLEANKKIEDAYFKLAQIYQNSLQEIKPAIENYTILLQRYPETKYEPQVFYEIAKMQRNAKNTEQFNKYFGLLKSKYPSSRYISLLDENNSGNITNNLESNSNQAVNVLYNEMYQAFRKGKYEEAIATKIRADKEFGGNVLQSKFDYLLALCWLKKGQEEKGIAGLQQVLSDYAGSPIADQAQANLEAIEKRKKPVAKDSASGSSSGIEAGLWTKWDGKEKLMYLIVYPKGTNSNMLRALLSDFVREKFSTETLEIDAARSIGETNFLTISGFNTAAGAQSLIEALKKEEELFASRGVFEYEQAWISMSNYKKLALNNRVNNYLEFYKQK